MKNKDKKKQKKTLDFAGTVSDHIAAAVKVNLTPSHKPSMPSKIQPKSTYPYLKKKIKERKSLS